MNESKKEFIESSLNLKEAARFLGFQGTERLRKKILVGAIPAFKCGRSWMILKNDLIEVVELLKEETRQQALSVNARDPKPWQSAKRKAAHTIIQDSQSAALECKNLRKQLLERLRKNTKKNAEEK